MTWKNSEIRRIYERKYCAGKGRTIKRVANTKWRQKRRAEYKQLKAGLKCERCGQTHIATLQFHHLDGSKKSDTLARAAKGWSTKRMQEEIAKCIVLCANCHAIEHWKDTGNGTA